MLALMGFHPGLVCGAPLGHSERLTFPEPSYPDRTTMRQRDPSRSEHRNVDTLIPVARPRESRAGPNVPCERRTDPAEPSSRH
jgi:hypothetical protein